VFWIRLIRRWPTMKRTLALLLLGTLLSMSCGGGGSSRVSPSEVLLEYKDLGNQEVFYKANTNIDTNVGGQTRTWLSETKAGIAVVAMPEDGSIVRSATYIEYTMGEISGTGALVPNPSADEYVGESVQFSIDKDGKLDQNWRGLDGITGMTVEGVSYTAFIMQQLTEIYQPFPDYPVTVGGKWQSNIETMLPVGGGDLINKITIDYELIGFGQKAGRDCARVKMKLTIMGSAQGRRRGKFWMTATGEGTGEFWFDYTAGLMVEYGVKETITRDLRWERAGEEDVASQTTSVAREFKVKLES
jgi:hypothetical protein